MNEQNNIQQSNLKNSAVIWKIAIVIIITALIVGGGIYWWHKSVLKKIKNEASKTQQMLQQQIDELQTELMQLQQKIETAHYFFKIHALDDDYREKIDRYIAIPINLSLLEKLRLLADNLSKFNFGNLPINVLRVENRDGKKIAIVELEEMGISEWPKSWRTGYFQGSLGGCITTVTLTKTFLQKDYKGSWIDGVEFYYDGKPISDDWDHIGLSGTIYRKEKQE